MDSTRSDIVGLVRLRDAADKKLATLDAVARVIEEIRARPKLELKDEAKKGGRGSGALGPDRPTMARNGQRLAWLRKVASDAFAHAPAATDLSIPQCAWVVLEIFKGLNGSIEPIEGPFRGHIFPVLGGKIKTSTPMADASRALESDVLEAVVIALNHHRKPKSRAKRFILEFWNRVHLAIGGPGTRPFDERHLRRLLDKKFANPPRRFWTKDTTPPS